MHEDVIMASLESRSDVEVRKLLETVKAQRLRKDDLSLSVGFSSA